MTPIDVRAWSGVRLGSRLGGGARNEVWSGSSPDGPVAIRRSCRSAESLDWELALLDDLEAAGFVVPVPIPTDSGTRSVGNVIVQRWIEGREPASREDWEMVAVTLGRVHEVFVGYRQRPQCLSITELNRVSVSVDADLSVVPDDVVDQVLEQFAAVTGAPMSLVHGDPGPANIRITDDGHVGLLDWDESRVDVTVLDLANLGVQVLGDAEHEIALDVADAWEAINAWVAEPTYARERLVSWQARRPRPA